MLSPTKRPVCAPAHPCEVLVFGDQGGPCDTEPKARAIRVNVALCGETRGAKGDVAQAPLLGWNLVTTSLDTGFTALACGPHARLRS